MSSNLNAAPVQAGLNPHNPVLGNGTRSSLDQRQQQPERLLTQNQSPVNESARPKLPSDSGWANRALERVEPYKDLINFRINEISSALCALTFLNGNLGVAESAQTALETASEWGSKIANISTGGVNFLTGARDNNAFLAGGGLAELPIAGKAGSFNYWLYRGYSYFFTNQQGIFSRLGKRGENGERLDASIPENTLSAQIEKDGLLKGMGTMAKEWGYLAKEIAQNPSVLLKSMPHSLFLSTSSQLLGCGIASAGNETLGAVFRTLIGGIGVDYSFILDGLKGKVKNASDVIGVIRDEVKGVFVKSKEKTKSYFMTGLTWSSVAVIEFIKRFDFFSGRINNGTELAMSIDRLANALFTDANDKKKDQTLAEGTA